jgi:hypothetical protein
LREVNAGINETYAAVTAKALTELNPSRTEKFLLEELKGENHHRLTTALAGMGLIASPAFAQAVADFRDHPPQASPGNPYPPDYIFKNPASSQYLDYALHRCRGFQRWTLQQDENGKYFIKHH